MSAATLEVRIHYPASQIQVLPSKAIFTLVLCYKPGCPARTMWDQSFPGAPYNTTNLTIYQDDLRGNDLYVKTVEFSTGGADEQDDDDMAVPGDVFVAIYAAYDPP